MPGDELLAFLSCASFSCEACDSVVGEDRVAAIAHLPLGHMAARAVSRSSGVRLGQRFAMAREAPGPVVLLGTGGVFVGVVAGTAPHLSRALLKAFAERELFYVAYHFEWVVLRSRRRALEDINREYVFQSLTGPEVGKRETWIGYLCLAGEMALLADAVALPWWKLPRIDNVTG